MKVKIALATLAAAAGLSLSAPAAPYNYETTPTVQMGKKIGEALSHRVQPPSRRAKIIRKWTGYGAVLGIAFGFGASVGAA